MDLHERSRRDVCICGRKAIRILSAAEKERINSSRDTKLDFAKDFMPVGVCKKCEPGVRLRGKCAAALWEDHARQGFSYVNRWRWGSIGWYFVSPFFS